MTSTRAGGATFTRPKLNEVKEAAQTPMTAGSAHEYMVNGFMTSVACWAQGRFSVILIVLSISLPKLMAKLCYGDHVGLRYLLYGIIIRIPVNAFKLLL